jgi:hypothetical protein
MNRYVNVPPPLIDPAMWDVIKKYTSPQKSVTYIITNDPYSRSDALVAINGKTGMPDFGPSLDMFTLIQSALDAAGE